MYLDFEVFERGIAINHRTKRFLLRYPSAVWNRFSKKSMNFLVDNLGYVSTACMPLVSGLKEVKYNISRPFFKKHFDESILRDIPSAVEEYEQSGNDEKEKFLKIKHIFKEDVPKNPVFEGECDERAVVPFSSGKDSLLSLAVSKEINLNPVPIYINDTVSPAENKLKLNYVRKVSKENALEYNIVLNEFEKLNDFEYWNEEETCVGYCHMIVNFCFVTIPFLEFYNAKHIILGNELDLNNKFLNKEGVECYPSFDQSFEGTKRLNEIMKTATQNKANVTSVISPIHDLAIMKVLHHRYPGFSKYHSSCACLDGTNEKRWCHSCSDDVKFYTYMKAIGKDPKSIGLRDNMFDKEYIRYNSLFRPEIKNRYEKAEGDDQMIFAHYLAYKNQAGGYAIEKFKERYLDYARENEDRLYKEYFGIHSMELIPNHLRNDVKSIYKEQLNL